MSDIGSLPKSAHRDEIRNSLLNFFAQFGSHIGLNKSWGDNVYGDVAAGEFLCRGLGKPNQTGLGGGVISLTSIPDDTGYR